MANIGALVINVQAELSDLKKLGTQGVSYLRKLGTSVREVRKDMRMLTQLAQVTAIAKAWQFVASSMQEAADAAKALREESARTGLSVETLSLGRTTTGRNDNLAAAAMAHEGAMSRLKTLTAEMAANMTDYVGAVLNAQTLATYQAQRNEIELTLAAVRQLRIEDGARITKLNELLDAARDRAAGTTAEDKAIAAGVESHNSLPVNANNQITEEQVRSELARHRVAAEMREREKRDAEELVRIEEQRKATVDQMVTTARDRALAEGKTARELAVDEARRHGATIEQIREIDMWHRNVEKKQAEERGKKRKQELDKWAEQEEQKRAQIALDEMQAAEDEQKRKAEQSASILGSRGGISAVESGTQAALSAIAASRRQDSQKIEAKQLTELRRVNRNLEKQQTTEPVVIEQI